MTSRCAPGSPQPLVGPYRQRCDDIAAHGYEGFVFDAAAIQEATPV